MLNRTGAAIDNCVIHWGNQRIEFASEDPNGLSTNAFYSDPIPDRARLTWTSADGDPHAVDAVVNCREGRPGSGGYVCCVLLPDHTLAIEAISAPEFADFHDPHNTFRVGIESPQYIVATYNATQEPISDLRVFFGTYQVNAETRTEPNATDVNAGWRFAHGMPYPVPDEVRVTWKSPGGVEHEQTLQANGVLPEDLNGVCIVTVIDEQSRLVAVPWSKRERWWMETRP